MKWLTLFLALMLSPPAWAQISVRNTSQGQAAGIGITSNPDLAARGRLNRRPLQFFQNRTPNQPHAWFVALQNRTTKSASGEKSANCPTLR